jgi:hypothetical protein
MDVQEMEYYRLQEPDWAKTVGQGDPPDCLTIVRDETEYCIPWGLEVRASTQCDPDHEVANLEHDPPLVRVQVIEELSDQFEHVPSS